MDFSDNSHNNKAVSAFLLNTKARTTKELHELILRCFCKFTFNTDDFNSVDWSELTKEKVLLFIVNKKQTVKFNTVNNYLSILKMFTDECYKQGFIDLVTYNDIRDIKKYRGASADNGRALTLREINKIKAYFSKANNARQIRNYAIFSLAVSCGLRRAEISALNVESLKGRKLHINGKGNKARTTYLSHFALEAVKLWLSQLTKKKGALFVHVSKSDSIKQDRLGIKGIHYIITCIHKNCGLNGFTAHDLRRTFATTLLKYNIDVFTVQYLLGHSDPRTTMRYDKRGEKEKINAINTLPF